MDKMNIKKILAPTDLSDLSQAGVRYALKLASALGAEVTVYHAVNYDEIVEYGEEMKERVALDRTLPPGSLLETYQVALARFLKDHFSDLKSGVQIHEKVELGRAEENIVERAKTEGSDLIVISTHGRTGLSHILMGSVTEKVVRHAPCPVLSIRPQSGHKATEKASAAA